MWTRAMLLSAGGTVVKLLSLSSKFRNLMLVPSDNNNFGHFRSSEHIHSTDLELDTN